VISIASEKSYEDALPVWHSCGDSFFTDCVTESEEARALVALRKNPAASVNIFMHILIKFVVVFAVTLAPFASRAQPSSAVVAQSQELPSVIACEAAVDSDLPSLEDRVSVACAFFESASPNAFTPGREMQIPVGRGIVMLNVLRCDSDSVVAGVSIALPDEQNAQKSGMRGQTSAIVKFEFEKKVTLLARGGKSLAMTISRTAN